MTASTVQRASAPDGWEARVRADFPYREGRTYLNSAGAGLSWPGQGAAAAAYFEDVARLGADAQPLWRQRAETVREKLAQLLGVTPREVCFFRNTTEVINLAAQSIDWAPGDEVVVAEDDFPSVLLPWGVAEQAGGTVVRVPVESEDARVDRLLDALTPRTRALVVTHVNSVTGTRVDLDRLGTACREVGALLVVDGIAALGSVPVDLELVDVYASAMFKWMLAGWGTSVGVFSARATEMLTPAYRGYRNPAPSRSFEYADPNYPGLYVLDATLDYLTGLGWSRIYERVDALTSQVVSRVEELGLVPRAPHDARAGIVAVDVGDAEAMVQGLRADGIDVVHKAGLVRVSPHFYNAEADVDRFAEALEQRLER